MTAHRPRERDSATANLLAQPRQTGSAQPGLDFTCEAVPQPLVPEHLVRRTARRLCIHGPPRDWRPEIRLSFTLVDPGEFRPYAPTTVPSSRQSPTKPPLPGRPGLGGWNRLRCSSATPVRDGKAAAPPENPIKLGCASGPLAPRCDSVTDGIRRRFRAYLTQFLHNFQVHLSHKLWVPHTR